MNESLITEYSLFIAKAMDGDAGLKEKGWRAMGEKFIAQKNLIPTITPDYIIEIPHLQHFRFKHGRDVVRKRKTELEKVSQQIHTAKAWLSQETKYLHDNCAGHTYRSTGDGDGSSQDWCQDCGKHK